MRVKDLLRVSGLIEGQNSLYAIAVYLYSEINIKVAYISHFIGVAKLLLC
jgi:hypothetical protein